MHYTGGIVQLLMRCTHMHTLCALHRNNCPTTNEMHPHAHMCALHRNNCPTTNEMHTYTYTYYVHYTGAIVQLLMRCTHMHTFCALHRNNCPTTNEMHPHAHMCALHRSNCPTTNEMHTHTQIMCITQEQLSNY